MATGESPTVAIHNGEVIVNLKDGKYPSTGKFGVTYRCKHKKYDKVVVRHIIPTNLHKGTIESLNTKIGDILKNIEHKNVIKVLDHFIEEGKQGIWIIYEHCKFQDLHNFLKLHHKAAHIAVPESIDILTQCAEGLSYLHNLSEPIIHCFLHPGNILFKPENGDYVVKLSDYLKATVVKGDVFEKNSRTLSGNSQSEMQGKIYNNAPEFIYKKSTQRVTTSFDVFCMGIVFHAVLSHDTNALGISLVSLVPIIPGCKDTSIAEYVKSNKEPKLFEASAERDETNLHTIIEGMLCRDPKDRTPMTTVAEQLQALNKNEPCSQSITNSEKEPCSENFTISEKEQNSKNYLILKKFTDILQQHGPMDAADSRLMDALTDAEGMHILKTAGSVEKFMSPNCSTIKIEDGKLEYKVDTIVASLERMLPGINYQIPFETGLFICEESKVSISIPPKTENHIANIYLNVKPLPVEEKLPGKVRSDMITLLPSGLVFKQHILVKFPIKDDCQQNNLQLMYCRELRPGESNNWIHIDSSSRAGAEHSEPAFFYVHCGEVYLFTQHFCSIVVTEHSTLPPQRGIRLQVSAYAKKVKSGLAFTVGMNCSSHSLTIPNEHSTHGILVGSQSQCFYEKEGPISIAVEMIEDVWLSSKFPTSEMPIDDLLHACQFTDLYYRTIPFKTKPGNEMTGDRVLTAQAFIYQKQRGCPINIDTCIEEMSSSIKEESTRSDIALAGTNKPDDGDFQNNNMSITNVNILVADGQLSPGLRSMMMQLPIERKQADCVFNRSIPIPDQDNLCNEIDSSSREVLNGIAERSGAPENFNQLTALQILQIWKMSVHAKKRTWRELYDVLIELGCHSAALLLKCVCDKHNVISRIEELKNLMTVGHITSSLIAEEIVDFDDRDKMNSMIPSQAAEYLVYNLLITKPYSRLQAFFAILNTNKDASDFLKLVMICPEDLEMAEE